MHAGITEPQRPLPNRLPSHDISSLLDGLGAADFEDFDDEDPLSSQRQQSPEIDEFYEPPAPAPADIPTTVSFATGGGKRLAQPSEAALSRAMKILRDAERDAELEDAPHKRRRTHSPAPAPLPPSSSAAGMSTPNEPSSSARFAPPSSPLVGKGFGLASGRDVPRMSGAAVARARAMFGEDTHDTPVRPVAPTAGFQLANGSAAPPAPQSEAAKARACAMLGEDVYRTPARPADSASGFQLGNGSAAPLPTSDRRAALAFFGEEDTTPARPMPSASGFQLGTGSAAPPPPSAARAQALAMMAEADASSSAGPSSLGFSRSLQTGAAGPSTSGFLTGSKKAIQAPKAESVAFALALLNDEDMTDRPAGLPAAPQRSTSPAPFTAPRPTRPTSLSAPARPSTPARLPLATTTNTFQNPMSTPTAKTKLPQRINIATPGSTPRRIGLGTGSARGKPKKGFVTPFKRGGVHSAPSALRTPLTLRTPVTTPVTKPPPPAKIYKSVFDLTKPPDRKGMRASFFYPGFYPPAELAEMGLPDEIWAVNLSNAEYYHFIGENSSTLGTEQALERLKVEGCDLATQKWVDNHWRLILWKIAGQVMAKPSLFDEKWNWYEVLCQLRYRYEREYGAAQRPILRRIQEHDSSPGLPMILCVAGIHRPAPVMNEKDEPIPQLPYLDLTDGWYIVRALLDGCLARALDKGKIRVGRKLGLSGAKLESGSDGAEVLEAYDKSHLVLSGNSTHLAKWDARLGLQRQPFIAGLSSLSVDGGAVVLMDLVLERVYPVAFMDADRSSREAPWSEEEEHQRRDAWRDKYDAESSRLREGMQQSLEKLQELASYLADAAAEVESIRPGSPPDVEAEFDELMEARDFMARLRSLSPTKTVHLARYARERAQAEAEAGRAEVEAQLRAACPRREVRDFRMVRVRDGREGNREQARTAMLHVWDARALGDELKEGRRFLVSSLVPGRSGDWSPPSRGPSITVREVYLHTRKDTRWQKVEQKVEQVVEPKVKVEGESS